MRVKQKILVSFVLVSFLAATSTGWISYEIAKKTLLKEEYNKLNATRETKKRQVESYFRQISNQIITFSENYMIIEAMQKFGDAFHSVSREEGACVDAKEKLSNYYLKNYIPKLNEKLPFLLNKKDVFPTDIETICLQSRYFSVSKGFENSKYDLYHKDFYADYEAAHNTYHPILQSYKEKFNFYNMFLVDADSGFVVYSEKKEVDFASNLKTGPWRDTNLGKVFRMAAASDSQDFCIFTDFELYLPDLLMPAAFAASPIFDGNEKIGVLVFQIKIDEINSIMTSDYRWEAEGMGKTGECYLVGADTYMRSDSRLLHESTEKYFAELKNSRFDNLTIEAIKRDSSTILVQPAASEPVMKALHGQTGAGIFRNYLNVISLTSYSPLDIPDFKWAIISESNLESEEVFLSLNKLRIHTAGIAFSIAILGAIVSIILSNLITKPLQKIILGTKEIAEGRLLKKVDIQSKDELGQLAESFNKMAENLYSTTYSKDQMDSLLNSMNDALFVVEPIDENNKDLFIKTVNEASCRLLEYNKDELINEPINKIFAFDEVFPEDYEADLRTKMEFPAIEKRLAAKSGKNIWTLFSISTMIDRNGEPTGLVCIAHDITSKKQKELALIESKNQFSSLIEQSNDAIFLSMVGKLILVNNKFYEMFKISEEEIKDPDFTFMKIVSLKSREFMLSIEQARQSGQNVQDRYEFTGITTHGKEIEIEASTTEILYKGKSAVQGILRDITERNELERQLRQSQKMEAIGRLAGGVAHDFNNLLTAILGHCDLGLITMKDNPALTEPLTEIRKAATSASNLTRQLLAFSRKQNLMPKVQDLRVIISDLKKMLMRIIGEDIKLITEAQDDLWRVKIDPGQIEQVIVNLAVNARDAMPHGGKLTFDLSNIEIDEAQLKTYDIEKPGKYVMLKVTDTGMGMSDEVQSQIFDPFFTTKDPDKGTGLGLSTVYGIIKQSWGSIVVESELNIGTSFIILFPIEIGALEKAAEDTKQESIPIGNETVMVVEDDDLVRKLAVNTLKHQGYHVLQANDGNVCYSKLNDENICPDILLTDIVMPNMMGTELAKLLKKKWPDLPVLFMSGYSEDSIVNIEGIQGAVNFIQKPFRPMLLAQKIRELLDMKTTDDDG